MSREGQMDNGVRDNRTYHASKVLTFVRSQGRRSVKGEVRQSLGW